MPLSDAQMNEILTKVSENIPSDCATYDSIRNKSTISVPALNSTRFEVSDYESYRNDIEFVNSFNEQVLVDEANYFTKKYGSRVYDYLKEQREKYRAKNAEIVKAAGCKNNCPIDPSLCTDVSGNNTGSGGGKQGVDKTGIISYLQQQLNLQNPDTIYKKIEYRDEAHELLSSLNSLLTVLYFSIFAILMVILIVTQKVMVKDRFMIYLFLFVLPFIFPYLYEFMKYLFFMVFPTQHSSGPKNAFLENKDARIDSYTM